jgi:CheY-like chemotaxis protein
LRILAADDSPQNLELLTLLLGGQHHTIVPAANGLIATQLAAEQHFDVVLMDVQMPEMDGLTATRHIRAQEARCGTRRVPIIALSASVLMADRQAALEAGMDAFASKPIDLPELTFEIARATGREAPVGSARSVPSAGTRLLNSERGLERWGGRLEAYLRALRHFVAEYARLPTLLSSYGAAGGAADARALAHRVKGAAANLGLEALAALLGEFERHVLVDAHGVVPPLLVRLRQLFADTLAAVAMQLAKSPTAGDVPPAVKDIDSARVCALSHKIHRGFSRGELDGGAFAQLMAELSGHIEEARLDELQRTVDDFDFVLADARLLAVCAPFEPPVARAAS